MAHWVVAQLTALCTVLSFFYISESLERHSLTERPRLSSLLVLLLSGCFCFAASFFSKWLPGAAGRFTASRRKSQGGPLLSTASDEALLKGSNAHLPPRPRKLSLPLLIFCIVVRLEVFHRVNYMQQCSTPGIESFLCLLLITYEIFSTRQRWGFPKSEYDDDPWRSLLDDLYDWFSGPRVTLVMNVATAFAFSLGTFLSVRQFTRSTYFCVSIIDSRWKTISLQWVGLVLDATITVLLWRILAWTRTAKLKLQTLGIILTLSAFCMTLLWLSSAVYSGHRRINVPFGSLYGFDVMVDSFAFACLMISATFWVCETSPITPAAVVTFLVGAWSSGEHLLHLGNWEHNSKMDAMTPIWIATLGAISFLYFHDLRMVLFLRRIIIVILLVALLVAATIFAFIRPIETFNSRHPINDVIYKAHVEHDRWLRHVSSSTDLHIAISTYQERHDGRNPPPGFEHWYQFAKGSIVIDDYPQIDRDLAPFWGVSPETLRQRVELMATQPTMPTISIQSGDVSRSDTGDEGKNQDLDEVVDLIKPFSEYIPDMVLPINFSPTPQILPSWEKAHSQTRADLSSIVDLISRRSLEESNRTAESLDMQNGQKNPDGPAWETTSARAFRQMQIEACPPGSRARTDPHWNIGAFCTDCASRHSRGQVLINLDKSLETCAQPDLTYLHGFSMTNPRTPPIRHLLPLFSASKTDEFSDIIIPLPRSRLEEPDIKWQFTRRYDSLVWRGAVGAHAVSAQALRGSHKYRLLHLAMDPNPSDEVTMVLPLPGRKDKFGYEKVSATQASTVVPFTVGIEGTGCMGSNCERIQQAYGTRTDRQETLEYRYVLLLDEDDGPPAQMMRTLRSNSVPLVSTIFRTWYTDRLMPWLHFVPIDPRYQALHSTYAYFTGTERRPNINGRDTDMKARESDADWIAQEGQKWVEKAMGHREMEVYLFRLLLEWARLLDEGRDKIGTWRDDEGKLHDSGWTLRQEKPH